MAISARAAELIAPLNVAASEDSLRFSWKAADVEKIEIREIPMHTTADPVRDGRVLWQGNAVANAAVVPRFDGARDRLYAKFQLADAVTHAPLGGTRYVTDFSMMKGRTPSPGAPKGKKGLTRILNMSDAVALGIQQVNQNIDIGGLIDWQSPQPAESFEFEGRRIGLRPQVVGGLDRDLLASYAAGMRVTGILLNYVHARTPRSSPLAQPRKIWDVVQKAGTPDEDQAFEFALKISGRDDWSSVVSKEFDPPAAQPSGTRTGPVRFRER